MAKPKEHTGVVTEIKSKGKAVQGVLRHSKTGKEFRFEAPIGMLDLNDRVKFRYVRSRAEILRKK